MFPLEQPGPAQFDALIHFTGRPPGTSMTRFVPPTIAGLSPATRLDNILWEQRLYGFAPFGAAADQPMICLSESPPDHLRWLLGTRVWPPWGLMFRRQSVYDAGGGPVWYVRQQQYDVLRRDQLRWANRLDTTAGNRSDWLHEREWRIPVSSDNPTLSLSPGSLLAILIGTPDWVPSRRVIATETGYFIDQSTGQYCDRGNIYARPELRDMLALPPLWQSIPRIFWDPDRVQFNQV